MRTHQCAGALRRVVLGEGVKRFENLWICAGPTKTAGQVPFCGVCDRCRTRSLLLSLRSSLPVESCLPIRSFLFVWEVVGCGCQAWRFPRILDTFRIFTRMPESCGHQSLSRFLLASITTQVIFLGGALPRAWRARGLRWPSLALPLPDVTSCLGLLSLSPQVDPVRNATLRSAGSFLLRASRHVFDEVAKTIQRPRCRRSTLTANDEDGHTECRTLRAAPRFALVVFV